MQARWAAAGALIAATAAVTVDRLAVRGAPRARPATTAAVVHDDGGVTPVEVTDGGAPPPSRHTGAVEVRVRDDHGAPVPARLTFVPERGTAAPRFTTTDIGREEQGAVLAFDRAFVLRGDAVVHVPAGRYRVVVGHGPEWDVAEVPLVVTDGGDARVDATLHHVVDTPGWISADLHVHAAASFDSKVPMADRVHQFVADGVDLIVSTDHNTIADYAPVIAELGVSDLLASLPGDEVTTRDWGHFGAFPLAADDAEAGRGAVPVAGRTPAAIFADLRARAPGVLIDVHHPRLEDGRMGYFHLAELDRASLTAKRPGYSEDFDAIEVLNGYQDPDRKSVEPVLADWFAFLRRGHRVAATGNSDTHHLTFNLGGYPRNYVRVADATDPAAVVAAIRAGHAFFTTGPILDVDVGGAGPGDEARVDGAEAAVHVVVRAAPWIDVARVTVYVDGEVAATRAARGRGAIRLDEVIRVPVRPGAFVVVRADGDRPMAPAVGDGAQFRVLPLAVANPIWIAR